MFIPNSPKYIWFYLLLQLLNLSTPLCIYRRYIRFFLYHSDANFIYTKITLSGISRGSQIPPCVIRRAFWKPDEYELNGAHTHTRVLNFSLEYNFFAVSLNYIPANEYRQIMFVCVDKINPESFELVFTFLRFYYALFFYGRALVHNFFLENIFFLYNLWMNTRVHSKLKSFDISTEINVLFY